MRIQVTFEFLATLNFKITRKIGERLDISGKD